MSANTLLLRFEAPLQAWGDNQSKFVIRRTAGAPTKSGVIGMLCAALGVGRSEAPRHWLAKLNALQVGVRIDRPGIRWWDYHTVGAGMQMRTAEGGHKPGAMLTRREYLCDASFLVALQGDRALISQLDAAIAAPKWTLYLGRKSCPPSRPIAERPSSGEFRNLTEALESIPWQRRLEHDAPPAAIDCLLDWRPTPEQPEAPNTAEVWYDVPRALEPPSHEPRFVVRAQLRVGQGADVEIAPDPAQSETPLPSRPTADYTNPAYRSRREQRLEADHGLCLFCKAPANTVQHITYRHAGGAERLGELRALCRLCHDAVTMIEYGLNMGLDRINPEDPRWRDRIIRKREEIIRFRSLETRRRKLAAEEV